MTAARAPRIFPLLYLALALVTAALYWPATRCPFTLFDDGDYITHNAVVQAGLTWDGLVWAFNGTHVANWHPLTWLSHMLDCQLFGLNPGGHHLTNVIFHIANTLLLFTLLRYLTGAEWRSAVVAALFAWHPLHVESVVWISERKDVLCAFFWLLALLAYAHYAKAATRDKFGVALGNFRHPALFYALALLFCAGALLSKPMAVTLPFTLLLLDFWPLHRMLKTAGDRRDIKMLFVEKIPFFLLSFILCALTFLAQHDSGSVCQVSWGKRLENIPVAYARYISKTFWPEDLSIYYHYVYDWSAAAIVGSMLLLLAISTLALLRLRQQPWLAFGWFWFLGTLVPVIGLVQAGMQSMADRYSYIPSIGLFVVAVWGATNLCAARPNGKLVLQLLGGSTLTGCVLAASLQISYWQNNIRLFAHTVDIYPDNFVALNGLGCAFNEFGRRDEAIKAFKKSVLIGPNYWPSERNLALTLLNNNQPDEAFKEFVTVINLLPDDASLRYEVAGYLMQYGRFESAEEQLEAAVKLKPAYPEARNLLGTIFIREAKLEEAARQFSEALKTDPDFAEAHLNLGLIRMQQTNFSTAILHFQEAVRLVPDNVETRANLGLALLKNHQPREAEAQFSAELHLAPKSAKAQYYLAEALQQQGRFADALAHYREALRLSPGFLDAKTALDRILAAHPELKPQI